MSDQAHHEAEDHADHHAAEAHVEGAAEKHDLAALVAMIQALSAEEKAQLIAMLTAAEVADGASHDGETIVAAAVVVHEDSHEAPANDEDHGHDHDHDHPKAA